MAAVFVSCGVWAQMHTSADQISLRISGFSKIGGFSFVMTRWS